MDNTRTEETDVVYIIKSIKRGFTLILNFFNWIYRVSVQKWQTILLFLIIGGGLGFGIWYISKPFYTSYMSVSHQRFENAYVGEIIGNLNAFIANGNGHPELAKELNLSLSDAEKVKKIFYEPLNAHLSERYADSTSVVLPFRVGAEVYDNSVLDTLGNAILNYLENNPFALQKKALEKEALQKLADKIDSEIAENDSLKVLIGAGVAPRSAGGFVYGSPLDPSNVYRRSLELYEKQIQLMKKQKLNNSFYKMVGFSANPKPSNPGMIFFIFWGVLIAYIVALFRIKG